MLTTITVTHGNRPWEFANLEHYVKLQTRQPDRWIVVNDGEPYQYEMGQEVHVPTSQWGDPVSRNYLHALERVGPDEKVVLLEDDDYYAPHYLEQYAATLDEVDMCGVGPAPVYHWKNAAYTLWFNGDYPLMGSFGMKGKGAFDAWKHFLGMGFSDSLEIDRRLWKWYGSYCRQNRMWQTVQRLFPPFPILYVALKSGNGMGMGHNLSGPTDPGGTVLIQWLGAESEKYVINEDD